MNSVESTESVELQKYFAKNVYSNRYLLCNKPACCHSASKTHVGGRIFKFGDLSDFLNSLNSMNSCSI